MISSSKPLTFTENNFCLTMSKNKWESRRLPPSKLVKAMEGMDQDARILAAKHKIGDRLYLCEPTQIDNVCGDDVFVQYFWHKPEIRRISITSSDANKIYNRKSGINSKQIPRFMLKSFARFSIEITDVRCERLCDITEESAIAEGTKELWDYVNNRIHPTYDLVDSYLSQFEMLHGLEVLKQDPLVFVYRYNLCEDNINV